MSDFHLLPPAPVSGHPRLETAILVGGWTLLLGVAAWGWRHDAALLAANGNAPTVAPWLLLFGAAAVLGVVMPLRLLRRAREAERGRIQLLVSIVRAAEAGTKLPDEAIEARRDLRDEIRLAQTLGRDLRRMQTQLRLEQRRLQRFIESVSEGIVILDSQRRIRLCNRAATRFLHLAPRVQAVGFRAPDRMHERLRGAPPPHALRNYSIFTVTSNLEFLDYLRSAMAGTGPEEFDFDTADDPPRRISAKVLHQALDHRHSGVLVTLFDVTDRHLAAKLQQRFVSNASHEFKTPLTSIRGFAETLIDELDEGPIGRDSRRFLERILANAIHLEDVVRDLLDLGQLEETRGRLELAPVDLLVLCREVVATVEQQAERKDMILEVRADTSETVCEGDGIKLKRAILNLAANAVKYCPDGSRVAISCRQEAEGMIVEVADNGPGIPPQSLPFLFDRFYRVDKGRSRDMGGTGLGLAIVREVAQVHGGTIEVESRIGHGTTFRMRIPRRSRLERRPETAA